MMNDPVRRSASGEGFDLELSPPERELLRSLGPQIRELLGSDDPILGRIFPVAYPEDEDRETEYRLLVHDELRQSHVEAISVLEATADADHLDEAQLSGWMRAINDVRLILGTRLDVSEDGDERPSSTEDPRMSAFAVYDYLTWLQGEIIETLDGADGDGDGGDPSGDPSSGDLGSF